MLRFVILTKNTQALCSILLPIWSTTQNYCWQYIRHKKERQYRFSSVSSLLFMPLFPIRAIALMRRGNCRQSDTRYRQTPYSESTTIPTLILIAPCNPQDGLQQYNKHQVQACHIILGIENLANFGVKDKANASKNKKPTAVSITKIVHDKHILKQRLFFSLFFTALSRFVFTFARYTLPLRAI